MKEWYKKLLYFINRHSRTSQDSFWKTIDEEIIKNWLEKDRKKIIKYMEEKSWTKRNN